jgi:hypothetical protein
MAKSKGKPAKGVMKGHKGKPIPKKHSKKGGKKPSNYNASGNSF